MSIMDSSGSGPLLAAVVCAFARLVITDPSRRGRSLLCLLSGFLAAAPPLAGQEALPDPRGSYGLALSVSSTQWRDRVLNPARHTGWSASLDLTRSRRSAAYSSRLDLGLAFSPLKSRFDPSTSSFGAGLSLGYRREHGLGGTSGGVQVALGGQLRAAWDFAYFDSWDDSHFYWLTSYALGFAGSVSHAPSPGRSVSLEWDVPVAAVVSRPRERILYKVQEPSFGAVVSRMHRDMRLTSIHQHRALDLTLRFNRLRARLGRSLFWRLQYLETDLPHSKEVQILRHSFGATLGG